MQTLLVTGASGFVGSHVVEQCGRDGFRVRAMVRTARVASFSRRFPGVEIAEGDLRDAASLRRACAGADAVVHCAALMADADWAGRLEYQQVNVDGTKALLEGAAAEGVQRFVHVSTVGVLGSPAKTPAGETTPYGEDLSLYEWSKREAERAVLSYFVSGALKGCVLRPAQMYGPGMTYGWRETIRAIEQGSMRSIGRGDALVHLTHVDDVVEAIRLVLRRPEGATGEIFHIAGPRALPMRDVLNTLAELTGSRRPPAVPHPIAALAARVLSWVPYRWKPAKLRLLTPHRVSFFVRDHAYDTTRARETLGFVPRVDVADGFSRWLAAGMDRSDDD